MLWALRGSRRSIKVSSESFKWPRYEMELIKRARPQSFDETVIEGILLT